MSFGQELLRRRVPQILGAYALFGWGVIQFVGFVETRYGLSPRLVELAGLVLLVLLPSVAVFAWSHGAPGRDRWSRGQLVLYLVNLVAGSGLLLGLFWGTDLGAVTRTVEVQDENGERSRRTIPKSQYRRRVLHFSPEVTPADSVHAWLGPAVSVLLSYDLSQDLFVDASNEYEVLESLRREGAGSGPVPRPLMRSVAAEAHADYFLWGRITAGEGYVLTLHLEETRTGRETAVREYQGADLLALADRASRTLRQDLGIPEFALAETPDLPVADILTDNPEALRHFVTGADRFARNLDTVGAREPLETAVDLDPTFAAAHQTLYAVAILGQDMPAAQRAMESTLKYLYRLPERLHFPIKCTYYWDLLGDPDRALAVVTMWTEILPDDPGAWRQMAYMRNLRGETREEIAAIRRLLEVTPNQEDVLRRLADLYRRQGEYADAERTYQDYLGRNADDIAVYVELARVFLDQGRHSDALATLDRALLVAPRDPRALSARARVLRMTGRLEEAETLLRDATGGDLSAQDRARVLEELHETLSLTGRRDEAGSVADRRVEVLRPESLPVVLGMHRARRVGDLVRNGEEDRAREIVEELERTLVPPADWVTHLARAYYHLARKEPDLADAALDRVDAFVSQYAVETLRPMVQATRGEIREEQERWDEAEELFRQAQNANPARASGFLRLARVARKAGNARDARRLLERCLELYPAHARAHLEMARVQIALGRPDAARNHLGEALQIWKDADSDFEPRLEAESLLKEINDPS